jgi:hypothetical protein
MRRPELSVEQILQWADAFHERTGRWPDVTSGRVWEPPDEKWSNIDQSLRMGHRGLRRGQTLAQVLAKHRGKRNRKRLPKYSLAQILNWADAHQQRRGRWPRIDDGPIEEAPGETWIAVDVALRQGRRGLHGGSSLARLLAKRRHVRNRSDCPRLSVRQVLRWADGLRRTTGTWPTESSGPIVGSQGDTWLAVAKALRCGGRGLPRSTLFRLLAKHRGITRHVRRPSLVERQILAWCDEHHARTGKWPKASSGTVFAAPTESWKRIDEALRLGKRGLTRGSSLVKLVSEHRGVRSRVNLPRLSLPLIGRWARVYRRRHGHWPHRNSGPIVGSGGETWRGVNHALRYGRRGLVGRSSLKQLIASLK